MKTPYPHLLSCIAVSILTACGGGGGGGTPSVAPTPTMPPIIQPDDRQNASNTSGQTATPSADSQNTTDNPPDVSAEAIRKETEDSMNAAQTSSENRNQDVNADNKAAEVAAAKAKAEAERKAAEEAAAKAKAEAERKAAEEAAAKAKAEAERKAAEVAAAKAKAEAERKAAEEATAKAKAEAERKAAEEAAAKAQAEAERKAAEEAAAKAQAEAERKAAEEAAAQTRAANVPNEEVAEMSPIGGYYTLASLDGVSGDLIDGLGSPDVLEIAGQKIDLLPQTADLAAGMLSMSDNKAIRAIGTHLQYGHYGFYGSKNADGEVESSLVFYQGLMTPVEAMPQTGKANYAGNAFYNDAYNINTVGSSLFEVDFGEKKLVGAVYSDEGYFNPVMLQANIVGNRFIYADEKTQDSMSGIFLGPQAEEMTGRFDRPSENNSGTFGAALMEE